jgi:hypothetical protein
VVVRNTKRTEEMVYAMYDTTVSKNNPGHGFANAKRVIAFSTKAKLESFLEGRNFDMTAKRVSRAFALKNLETDGGADKGLFLDPTDTMVNSGNVACEAVFTVLRASRW